MEQVEHNLLPVEIAAVYLRHHTAETFHVRFPNQQHADHSIIKSFLGCSGYHRDNFDFNKYRLKLRRPLYITGMEMYELAKILTGVKDRTYSENSFTSTTYNARYNLFGYTVAEFAIESCEIRVMTDSKYHHGEVHLGLGYQYLYSKNFDMPVYFGEDHPMNGKTPSELGLAILVG